MNSRLAAGIAIAILTTAVFALAAQNESELIQSPEVLSQSVSADPTTTAGPVDINDLLPDESPTTSYLKTEPAQVVPDPTTLSSGAIAEEASTTTAPPVSSTTSLAPATTTAPPSGGFNPGHESSFASLINSHRTANGLTALSRDSGLDAEARAWSQQMAANGGLSHSNLSRFLPPWSSVGENVAFGGSVSSIFGGLTASSGHNANMLGDFTHLGVGVWVDSAGTLWTTHVFTK
ncbi:MAG: CAP domain-containing protein [Acidimicrobiia bacterium]